MAYHFFAMVSRMKYIDRWALMRNTRQENLTEHSHEVAVIAHALAVLRNRRFGGHVDAARAALLGLYHDLPETLTGDLPTPVKYHNPEIRCRRTSGRITNRSSFQLKWTHRSGRSLRRRIKSARLQNAWKRKRPATGNSSAQKARCLPPFTRCGCRRQSASLQNFCPAMR